LRITTRKKEHLMSNSCGTKINYIHIDYINKTFNLPHSHDFFECFVILSGQVIHILNKKEYHFSRGSFCILKPGDIHYYRQHLRDSFTMLNFMISKESISSFCEYFQIEESLLSSANNEVITDAGFLSEAIEQYEKIMSLPPYKKTEINVTSKRLLFNLISLWLEGKTSKNEIHAPEWFDNLLRELELRHNFILGVQVMNKICGKSLEHISRLFKKHFDMTPTQYLNEIRLNHARRLLTTTDMNIIDICYDAGFNTLSNFYKNFEDRFGMAPGSFRENISITDN
jgi:AraC family transcriptional regulator, dual regulator of chb operon